MNIGFVIPSFYPATLYGGPIFASWHLATELGARGHRVQVSTTNANLYQRLTVHPNRETEVAERVFVTYYADTILNRLSLPQLCALEADIAKVEIVHIHSIFSIQAPIAARTALKGNTPVLLSPHGSLSPDALIARKNYKKLWLCSLLQPIATKIAWHATSTEEARDIQSATGAADIHTIRHGLPNSKRVPNQLSRTEYFAKFAPGCAPGPAIVSMGRIAKVKGFDVLLRAFRGVRDKSPHAVLLIAGPDQGERVHLVELAKTLGISKSVVFLNFLGEEDRSDFLANADLFALASHHENFGLVYAEALALGTPVVATTNTPWQGVTKAGCGHWVPCAPQAIEEAILSLLRREPEALHQASRAYARQFAIQDVVEIFEATYQRLVASAKHSRRASHFARV